MSIIVSNLNFVYNPKSPFQKHALIDVNLEIGDGEFVGIVGHTGSGKSTFVQHLNGLIRVTSGEILVDGISLADKKVDLKALRAHVGMVFQYPEYQLFADTVYADIAFGPKNMGLSKEEIDSRVTEAIGLVGLVKDEVGDKSPFDLSGGEKRRVALAGVLAMRPKILVLDEPTAGLDPRGKREILALVKALRDSQGTTVIMVSHDMDEIYENTDKVIVFKEGRVVYSLPPRELFAKETEIEEMNLAVPQMAKVLNALEKGGYHFAEDLRTVEQVTDAIVSLRSRKGKSDGNV
ncbi:MAG: energy-coupling factor transporter ATPase [Clostridia bacterium]